MSRRAGRKGRRMELSRPSAGIRPMRPETEPIEKSQEMDDSLLQTPGRFGADGPMMVSPNMTYDGTLQWLGFSSRRSRPSSVSKPDSDFGTKRILAEMSLWELAHMRILSN